MSSGVPVENPLPVLLLFFFFFKRLGFFFFNLYLFLFIYLWLCWGFAAVRGASPAAASEGHSSSRCAGLSPSRPLSPQSTGSRSAGSVAVAHGPIAPRHVGSSQTRAPTPVPRISRQTLNHCANREVPLPVLFEIWARGFPPPPTTPCRNAFTTLTVLVLPTACSVVIPRLSYPQNC